MPPLRPAVLLLLPLLAQTQVPVERELTMPDGDVRRYLLQLPPRYQKSEAGAHVTPAYRPPPRRGGGPAEPTGAAAGKLAACSCAIPGARSTRAAKGGGRRGGDQPPSNGGTNGRS